jgi:hypothetical protein
MSDPKKILAQSQHIAVLGVNKDTDSYANKIVRKIRALNKNAYPINPNYSKLFGEAVYDALEKCPVVPDLVVFVVNPTIGIDYLNSIAQLGIKYIWLQPGTISTDLLEEAKDRGLVPIEACVLVVGNYL